MNKKFLKPVPMLVASLLASGAAGSIANQADASTEGQSVQNTANQELTLKPAGDQDITPKQHGSHYSHGSHTSHYSGR